MKEHSGSRGIVSHIFKFLTFLNLALYGTSAELHALAALHTKKELLVPIEMDAVWAPKIFWTLWQGIKPLAPCK